MTFTSATDDRSLLRASVSPALGTALSRVTGLVRVVALAWVLGQGAVSDGYNLANTAPNLLYELVLGGILSSTLVPLFVSAGTEESQREADERASVVMSLGLISLFVVTLLAVVASPLYITLFESGNASDAAIRTSVARPLLFLLVPQILFYGMTSIAEAILHARRLYAVAAFAPVLTNVITTMAFVAVGVLCSPAQLTGNTSIYLLGLGTTAGVAAMAFCVVAGLSHAQVPLRWKPDRHHPVVREIARLSGWTIGYVASNQAALLVVLALATRTADGAVSAYQTAFIFFQLPHGLLAVSVMTSTTPELSAAAAAQDLARLRARFREGLGLVLTLVTPAALALIILARPVVEVVLHRGRFDAAAATRTVSVLSTMAIGLPAFSAYLITLRIFYAHRDTKTPFLLNAGENLANIVFALALFSVGVWGLGLAFALAYLGAATAALIVAQRRFGGLADAALARSVVDGALVAVGTALPMVVGIVVLRHTAGEHHSLAELMVGVPLGLVGLIGTIVWFEVPGFEAISRRLRRRAS